MDMARTNPSIYIHCLDLIRLQLSNYRSVSGVQALLKGNAKKMAEQDEAVLVASGIPYTIIRAGSLLDTPDGNQGFSFEEVILLS